MKTMVALLALAALGGCAHKDKTAPCAPLASSYAQELSAPQPFDGPEFRDEQACGPARAVNAAADLFAAEAAAR